MKQTEKRKLIMAAKAKQVMLAEQWDESIDPTGWWMVRKFEN
jgi:hypothetical protein